MGGMADKSLPPPTRLFVLLARDERMGIESQMIPLPSWKALLIGGGSGIGKTTVARAIARHFGISVVHVDDIRLAIQQVTSPAEHPDLHFFVTTPEVWRLSPENRRDGLIGVGRAMSPALKMVIAHHVVVDGVGPIVLEGDGILPELAAQTNFANLKYFYGLKVEREVRAIFLYEPNESTILKHMQQRGRGFDEFSPDEQRRQARTAWLYGAWLHDEAKKYALPVMPVGAWSTLTERIRAFASE